MSNLWNVLPQDSEYLIPHKLLHFLPLEPEYILLDRTTARQSLPTIANSIEAGWSLTHYTPHPADPRDISHSHPLSS